ncbi:hypothetical protein QFW77_16280 [Luteimonas sp. RD2P54]|uniref:Secreted protein n=1 Tax=Luteimonas endophytica TaxID=3042023 RepID=A0ABT6JCG7_9GAMM|nr:hypothetical protein [Luteimonas endophytica]MDH5824532.1 hypothetical protein [Luteimonas endophytica]
MKHLMRLAVLACVLVVASHAYSIPSQYPSAAEPNAAGPSAAPVLVFDAVDSQPLLWEGPRVAQGYYPECATIEGTACSTPGARARCYRYQYQEPGVCVCQPDNVFACF